MAGLETTPEMFDLRMSEEARPLFDAVKKFIDEEVNPHTQEFFRLGEGREDRWGYGEGQLELLDSIKTKAKEQGSGISSSPMPKQEKDSRTLITHILQPN